MRQGRHRIDVMTKFLLTLILGFLFAFSAMGQDVKPDPAAAQPGNGNLLEQLGLTPDQVREIRQLNKQRKPAMEGAKLRVVNANRDLDAAIYADNVDEAQVNAQLAELQIAQADVARIRFTNELAIRRILTPEQLGRFRDLRRQVETAMQGRRQERMENGIGPGMKRGRGARPLGLHSPKPLQPKP